MRVTRLDIGGHLSLPAPTIDGPNTLILAFGSREQLASDTLRRQLRESYPRAVIAGCSTAGHFFGPMLADDGPVVVATQFERSTLRTASVPLTAAEHSFSAGGRLGSLICAPDLQAVLVLSDGITCNGSALVEGLMAALPPDTLVFGGLAADEDRFEETIVVDGEGSASGRVVAVGFNGDRLALRSGSKGGWERFGPERTITAAEDSVLHRLDSEPALDLYKRYLGERADELPGSALLFPLAIRPPESDYDRHVVRTVLGVDDDANSMTFAGDMPIGWRAQMMRASFDSLIDGASDSADLATLGEQVVGDSLCLGVSCVGRRLVLGSRTEDELDAVADVLGPETAFVGYYSYGELGPGFSGRCELHNQTMTLALIGER